MATNTKFQRDAVSIMRDGIKSQYPKASNCKICGSEENLEFHHYHTVALLVKNYAAENQLDFNNSEIALEHRTAFYEKYRHELVEHTVTLCRDHHLQLHKVYTKEPPLFTANKQEVWVERQRLKTMGGEDQPSLLPNNNYFPNNKTVSTKVQSMGLLDFRVDAPELKELYA